ncbi:MAG: type II toxin-antitoxin system VapC family toxin [Candidatus Thermoplasmatota archaeon]
MILVDSNVWAYFFDANTKEHARVKVALPRLLGESELLLPTVVQMEVVHYLVKRLGPEAGPAVDTFLAQSAEVEALTGGITVEAAHLLVAQHASGIGGRDACLLVMAKRRDAAILTNDKTLARVAKSMGTVVTNPVTS